ncbi:MAG: hypothetical protein PHV16_02055, partial [Candidatus Nanoarchaeia archaeon]|nr:hypothetical protein [Candidatus Nanoarchaeia archaeon]
MIYGYNSPMDRSYIKSFAEDREKVLDIDQVGIAMAMGIGARNIPEIESKIRAGASSLEIQFMGAGRGSQQAETPGMFGKYHRQALKELSQANEITLTTHASVGIPGLAGQDQQGNFSDEARKMAMDEVNRAIDFAGDTAMGGSVVVHTGEFQRPISEEPWAENGKKFSGFDKEDERAVIRVVNKETGQVIHQIRKNEVVYRPEWNKNEKGEYIDYENNVIPREKRVPKFDTEKNEFIIKPRTWDDFVNEAKEMTEENRKKLGRNFDEERDTVTPEEAFLKATLEGQKSEREGWALYYGRGFDAKLNTLNRLNEQKKILEEQLKNVSPEEKWKIQNRLKEIEEGSVSEGNESIGLNQLRKSIEADKEMVIGNLQQARDLQKTADNTISVKKYALEKSMEGYAQSGMRAWQETRDKGRS